VAALEVVTLTPWPFARSLLFLSAFASCVSHLALSLCFVTLSARSFEVKVFRLILFLVLISCLSFFLLHLSFRRVFR